MTLSIKHINALLNGAIYLCYCVTLFIVSLCSVPLQLSVWDPFSVDNGKFAQFVSSN